VSISLDFEAELEKATMIADVNERYVGSTATTS
jgi:hypothetical protein